MTITSDGNVGIGTTTPGAKLNILHTASTSIPALQVASSGSLADNDIVRFQVNGLTNGFRMFQDATSALKYTFQTGNVGIGTIAPFALLDVRDTMRVSGDINFGSPLNDVTLSSIAYDNGTGGIDVKSLANLGLYTAGSERMRITSGGNVGIGTTAPTNTLNVKGGLFPLKVEPTGSSTDGVNLTLGYTGLTFNTTAPAYKTFAITNSLTGDALGLMNFNNGGSTRMTIANAGNVGIGTTAPTSKLHIEEPTTVSGSAGINVQKTGVTSGNSYGVIAQTTGAGVTNYGGFFTASGATNNYGLVVSAGNVGIWNTAPAYQLHVGTSSGEISIGGTPTGNGSGRLKFINSNSVTNWQISTNDSISSAFEIMPSTVPGGSTFTTPAMLISNVGNVGIGTSSPAYPLDVNGSAKMTTIRDNTNSVGTSGQVLSSTGSALSWTTPSAPPVSTGYAVLRETKSVGVDSSVVFSGSTKVVRQLNLIDHNSLAITLNLTPNWNFIIPDAGTYSFTGRACYSVAGTNNYDYSSWGRLHIRNDTLGLNDAITGDTGLEFSVYSSQVKVRHNMWLNLNGILTVTANTVLSMTQSSEAQYPALNPCMGGRNININGVNEQYAVLIIQKLA